jgi:hypothetical protein
LEYAASTAFISFRNSSNAASKKPLGAAQAIGEWIAPALQIASAS